MPCSKDKSREDQTGRAFAGSQRQIQTYVNHHAAELNNAISAALSLAPELASSIRWVSPLASDFYSEYRDQEFLSLIGLSRHAARLRQFWPRGGPCWDALAVIPDGCILIEAKSHVREIYGNGCAASGTSRERIESALDSTKRWLNVSPESDWMGRLYQSANRYAYIFWLRECLKIPAYLVNVYFLEDPKTPTSTDDWLEAISDVTQELGVSGAVPYCSSVFLNAREDTDGSYLRRSG